MPYQNLVDRSVLEITGADATSLLQGLVTANVEVIADNTVVPCALLTPQGKIAFDFLVGKKDADSYFIDLRSDLVDDFIKRMTLYKLRADVQINRLESWQPSGVWHEPSAIDGSYKDLRFPEQRAVFRCYTGIEKTIQPGDFAKLRIQNAVAQSGADYTVSDIFPHDVYFDLNSGIDFKKGCYVGQEVISRMQHRGSARKRVAILNVSTDTNLLSTGDDITANGKIIGTVGSVFENTGLAIIRVDRLLDAQQQNIPIKTADIDVDVSFPDWASSAIDAIKQGQKSRG